MIDTRIKILAVLPFFIVVTAVLLINAIDLEHLILRPGQRQLLNFFPGESVMGIEKPDPVMNTATVIQTNLFNFEIWESQTTEISDGTQTFMVLAGAKFQCNRECDLIVLLHNISNDNIRFFDGASHLFKGEE